MKRTVASILAVFFIFTLTLSNASAIPVSEQFDNKENLANFPEKGLPVLMYHSISSRYDGSICVSEQCFEKQMKWLYENNYHTINAEQLYNAFEKNVSLPDKAIMITFDDGFGDNYKVGWPILQKYGFVATFFIVTEFIKPYSIDWVQLKDLIENGNSVGSHTVHHYNLKTLNPTQQEKELRESKRVLEEGLDTNINAFCYPFGGYNKTTLSLLPETGYSLSFTTNEGRVHYDDNKYLLNRVHICGGICLNDFIKKVA